MHESNNIREHMEVVGSCGNHVGVVDEVEGQTIKLTQGDENAGGLHHWIPMEWVATVDDVVHLDRNHVEAMRQWRSAAPTAG